MRTTALMTLALAALGVTHAQTDVKPATDWHGQVIYQVMPDRFFDGDASNNIGVNRQDPGAFHGGDLKGLTQKLDYIRDLGATAVWTLPVYQQPPGKVGDNSGYHGYWPWDFRKVDPRFGTLEDFQAFVKGAKDRGLKVMLDQVINHYGYGAPALQQKPGWFNDPAGCTEKGTDVYCPLAGLPDLDQRNPEVRQFLLENSDFWRGLGVDAYRYDAIKHVEPDFMEQLSRKNQAEGLFTVGEYYDGGAQTVRDYQLQGMGSTFDFAMNAALKDAVGGGLTLTRVRDALLAQEAIPDRNATALFLDNHDVVRFANTSLFEDQGRENVKYGVRALMTLQGIPVLWQGTEIAMRGGRDPDNRRDMRFEGDWTAEERAVFDVTKQAIKVRRGSEALSVGSTRLLPLPFTLEDDLLLFSREVNGEKVLVAWHNGRQRQTYSVRAADLPVTGEVKDLFGQDAKASVRNGFVHVSLPPRTATAFRLPTGQ